MNKVIRQNRYYIYEFINSGNSKTSGPQRLLLNLLDKINLKRIDKMLLYQILLFTIHGKIEKSLTKIINLKYQLQYGMKSLNYLMDHILYHIFQTILSISSKNMRPLLIVLQ